ncbi:restriction endonuclease subunit S [Sphingomonas paucimobilis]|uniref:restriction endonuclease subunit S n=1 Tax=Sphingomonas paucimobilis TaxID=13689 RepID=UPI0028D00E90|nr:restriction endonuclease subunit S [Sphingomonas paucimobilis]
MRRNVPLGKLVTIKSGYSPSTFDLDAKGAIPFVKVEDLNNCEIFQEESRFYTNDAERAVPAGAVIFPKRGAAIINNKVRITKRPICMDTNMMALIPNEEIDADYLYHVILTEGLFKIADTSSIPQINNKHIYPYRISLPALKEQKQISATFRTWDRGIETVRALTANARAQKKALMQLLLSGKHRLPGFSGEWQRKPINEISTRVTRRNDGTELPVLTISSTSGFVRQDEKYSRYMAGKSVETYILLNEGEFAYNKGNSKTYEFGCIFDLEGYERALVPHVYVCFKLKKGYSHRFYKALFEADYLAPQLGQLVNTGVRNNGLLNIKPSEFLGTRVPVPPLDEQDAIAAVMEAASRTVTEHQAQLTALRQEKAALMQQLLTGKRRVKLPESEVA